MMLNKDFNHLHLLLLINEVIELVYDYLVPGVCIVLTFLYRVLSIFISLVSWSIVTLSIIALY